MSEDPLRREAITAADPDGLLSEILDLPTHLHDALWRVQSANIAPQPAPGGLQVVGVDGLQHGGELARDALMTDLHGPLTVWTGPPTRGDAATLVLLASYSGDDPAVLDAFARTRDARRVALTTGGALAAAARAAKVPVVPLPGGFPDPRLALGYPLVACLELARLGGIAESSVPALEAAAGHLSQLTHAWGPDSPPDSAVKQLARARADGAGAGADLSALAAGEGPLQRVVSRLLADQLLALYTKVLAAGER